MTEKTRIFIDGRQGTTGLRIFDRLKSSDTTEVITLSEDMRKDITARREALNSCDIAFLCLPDAAAREAVAMVENPNVRIIDTSTAHRTEKGWDYGFPELSSERLNKIKASKRVAVPGCHASGFIALVYPLVLKGALPASEKLICSSVTGYSGGGKKMIAQYEQEPFPNSLVSPRQYGISQSHKHLPEMQKICGLETPPIFIPTVAAYYSGMTVTVPLFASQINCGVPEIKDIYKSHYNTGNVKYYDTIDEEGFIASDTYSGRDDMQISVAGNEDRILLVARYDNLGKGASGAALQCLGLMTGKDN